MCLGIPGRVLEVYDADGIRMGRIDFAGVVKEACLAYLPEIGVGDYAIIHVGFAITQVDEQSGHETLELFAAMGVLAQELAVDGTQELSGP